ncbi:MAG TPA: NUDIX domain-containing protein [Motilibacteraceae bacterium]|nr:NUDIX domain-containing protein [Motilibacteraceae bacterium]
MTEQPRVVAATWLCRRGDAILAVRPHGAHVFFLPGGVPEPGETLAQAAAREVAEEVGMRVEADQLTEAVRVETEAHGRPGWTVELVCFTGPGAGEPVADGREIVEIAWLPPQEGHRFAPAVRLALQALDPSAAAFD